MNVHISVIMKVAFFLAMAIIIIIIVMCTCMGILSIIISLLSMANYKLHVQVK